MKELSKKSYFNRRNYILENLENLKLSPNEALLVLIMDFLQEKNEMINYEILAKKMQVSEKEVDKIINDLQNRNYLYLSFDNHKIEYILDNLFDEKITSSNNTNITSILATYEEAFKRPLSQQEMLKIRELIDKYGPDKVIIGLKRAIAYNNIDLNYINKIIINLDKEA